MKGRKKKSMGEITCGAHIGSIKLNIFSLAVHDMNFYVPAVFHLCSVYKISQGWSCRDFLLVCALEAAQIILKELCQGELLLLP